MNTMRAILIGAAVIGTISVAVAQTAPGTSRTTGEATVAYLDQNMPTNAETTDRSNDPKWVAAHLSADDFHF